MAGMYRAAHAHMQGFSSPCFFWFCDAVQHFQEHSDEHKGKGVFLEASLENELTPQKSSFTQHNRLSRTKHLRIYLANRETKRQKENP